MKKTAVISLSLLYIISCTEKTVKQQYSVVKQPIPRSASIGIIIDSKNDIKNRVISQFMEKGFRVKAVNSTDMYTLSDAFTVKDYKYLAYKEAHVVLSSPDDTLTTAQKSFDSIYKLHIFNYETSKAEMLNEMKSKWGIKYLVVLEINEASASSWLRVIELDTLEIIAVDNYTDSGGIDSIISHFISAVSVR